jgi:hypothetical protein
MDAPDVDFEVPVLGALAQPARVRILTLVRRWLRRATEALGGHEKNANRTVPPGV